MGISAKQCCFVLLLAVLVACTPATPSLPAATSTVAPAATPTLLPATNTIAPTTQPTVNLLPLAEPGLYTVSEQDMHFTDTSRENQVVIIRLWYPATQATEAAPPDVSGGPYPVVFYSHGGYFGGVNHRKELAGVATHLASYGLVVVAVEHDDLSKAAVFVDRPEDILFVVGQLDALAADEWTGVLQMDQLGIMGLSQGTATTTQMGGARLDHVYLDEWCASHPGVYLCPTDLSIPEQGRALLAERGLTDENGLKYMPTDPRFHALALLAPCFAPAFGERGLKTVTAPTLLLASTADDICIYEEEAVALYYQHLGSSEHYLVSFIDAHHAYLLTLADKRRDQLLTAFFGYYLQGKTDYAQYLAADSVNNLPGLPHLAWGVYAK